jgi:hypothetical protein
VSAGRPRGLALPTADDLRALWRDGSVERSVGILLAVVALGVMSLAVGMLAVPYGWYVVAAAALLVLLGATTIERAAVPILAMPGLVVIQRVGGFISVSDAVLFGAFFFALLFGVRPYSTTMRSLLWLSVIYQVATLFTVVVNPYTANTVEWFHAWLSVGGALVMGWAVGRSGRARFGLSLFMLACVGIAVLTCAAALIKFAQGDFGPVYLEWPIAMHKNLIGCLLGFAAVLAYARPYWVGWPRHAALAAFWICSLAVLASQARQALLGLVVGVLFLTLRKDPDRKRSKLILAGLLPAMVFVAGMVRDQLAEENQFNSAYQRLEWYGQALEVWQKNIWVGVGLRWWETGEHGYVFQPPNAEIEQLSATGIVGLVGFVILFGGAIIVLWGMESRFANVAIAVLLTRLVQGQFDLFWSAIVVSVPFVLIGVAVGAHAYAEEQRGRRPAEPAVEPVERGAP